MANFDKFGSGTKDGRSEKSLKSAGGSSSRSSGEAADPEGSSEVAEPAAGAEMVGVLGEDYDEDEIPGQLALLRAERAEVDEEDRGFYVRVLGGWWTKKNRGVLADSCAGFARGGCARASFATIISGLPNLEFHTPGVLRLHTASAASSVDAAITFISCGHPSQMMPISSPLPTSRVMRSRWNGSL